MRTRKFIFFIGALSIIVLLNSKPVMAAYQDPVNSNIKVDYKQNTITDMDLDGLTDAGEQQLFNTNSTVSDTDNDGVLDGTEILSNTNPLDNTSPSALTTITINNEPIVKAVPWVWYMLRVTALMAFILLYGMCILWVASRIVWLRKLFGFINVNEVHRWLALQMMVFAFTHIVLLLFDKFLSFSISDILVPFTASYEPLLTALGVFAMYLMMLLIITAYLRRYLKFTVWRVIHYLNLSIYALVVIHFLYLGTDLKDNIIWRWVILIATGLLALLYIINIINKIKVYLTRKNALQKAKKMIQ